jgi:AcrR family transcriptional regulator
MIDICKLWGDNMVRGTHKNIINAFFRLAAKHPGRNKISLAEVANEANISKQAIYQKYYASIDDLIDDIHERLTVEIQRELAKYSPEDGIPMLKVLSEVVLPIVYKHRVEFKILYSASADPHWLSFVEEHYYNWTSLYLNKDTKVFGVSHQFLHSYVTKQVVNLIVLWLAEDVPDPPEVFARTFLKLMNCSIAEIMTENAYVKS